MSCARLSVAALVLAGLSTPAAYALTEITPAASAVVASTNDGNVPGNTVDNNLGTRWSGSGDGAWLQLDLGASVTVSRIGVAVYQGNLRKNKYDLQYSTGGGVWTPIVSGRVSSGTTTGEEPFDFAPVTARWVRYVGHNATLNAGGISTWNSVSEVSVFAPSATPTPTVTPTPTATPTPTPTSTATPMQTPSAIELTPGASGMAASTNDGNVPGNTVDKLFTTRWSASGDGQWLRADLGSVKTIQYVKIATYSGNTRGSRFDIQVSNDAATWTTALTGQTSGTTTALETFDFPDQNARYLRYLGHGNTVNLWNSITELEVWGSDCASCATPTPTSTPTPTTPRPTPTPTPTPGTGFRHPGVLVNRAQLDFIKTQVAAGAQPWTDAFNALKIDSRGSLSYVPHPQPFVECGPYSNPSIGCGDESNDSRAAYAHALLWYITGNAAHAQKSIEIMNGWARTFTGGHTNSNAPLQAGWYGAVWPRAAEIIRYTYSGWAASDIEKFKTMLKTQYLASTIKGSCANGNWEAVISEATINISVFLDDRTSYNTGVSHWRGRTPAYFYLTSDGASPKAPSHCSVPSWYGQTTFVDGLAQETCRDFTHESHGLAGLINGAETALNQGLDLYSEQATRFTKTMEFHAKYQNGAAVPSWLCGGSLNLMTGSGLTYEIAYNHFHNRKGVSLPETLKMLQGARPLGTGAHKNWETLTHYGVGSVGLP